MCAKLLIDFFHATTAYNILRAAGVPIGKMDFLGGPPQSGEASDH